MINIKSTELQVTIDDNEHDTDSADFRDFKGYEIGRRARLGARGRDIKNTIDDVVKASTCPMNLIHKAHEEYDHVCSSIEISFEIIDGFYKGWIKLHSQSDSAVLARAGQKPASIKAPFSFKIGE